MPANPHLHVMVWVDKEFLESEGMLHILHEVGLVADQKADWETIVEAAENTGGFALSGVLAEVDHGAGIWVSPQNDVSIRMMIPWRSVKCVVTAEDPHDPKIFTWKMGVAKRNGKPPAVPPSRG